MIVLASTLLLFSSISSFFGVKSQGCGTLDNPCPLVCNQSYSNRVTNTEEYFNLTITEEQQVRIELTMDDDTDYDLYVKWTPNAVPTEDDFDCVQDPHPGCGSMERCCWVNPPKGNYIIMVKHYDNEECSSALNYSISVTCGVFCKSDLCPNHYEYCADDCTCVDFRPRLKECQYYDYCKEGVDPTNSSEPCCKDNSTGVPFSCCILDGNPANCTDPSATRNESVIAREEYCAAPNFTYDITDVCIDWDYRDHAWQDCS